MAATVILNGVTGNTASNSSKRKDWSAIPFDPFCRLYVAQDRRPVRLKDVDPRSLTDYERGCLITNGTVTCFLEAQMLEPIAVVPISHRLEELTHRNEWLDLPEGSAVISRHVKMQGRFSSRVHASASALVAVDRVSELIGSPVDEMPEGIGRMLLDKRVEQFRELLWYGMDPAHNRATAAPAATSDHALTRTYRIISNRQPIMLITEWFAAGTAMSH